MAGEDGVQIHLFQDHATVFDAPARHLFEIADLGGSLGAAVCLHKADDDVDSLALQALTFLQQLVGLADAGCEAEINLEPAALLLPDQGEKVLGSRPNFGSSHGKDTSSE